MNDRILDHYLEEFQLGSDIEQDEAETLLDALISSDNQFLLTLVLRAWDEKGSTEDELHTFASIMRGRMKKVNSRHETLVDIVGTGGSKAKTFNVSTAAAFIIAGAGVPVAKHGNRAATSNSGSSDVLSVLGINVDIDPAESERHLNAHGICFMFAPRFHSLSPTLAKARRAVGHPTIFNNLGPLCNPASAPHQVIGVWDMEMLEKTANVMARLGTKRSWIVHGENGLDEISLTGATHVVEINEDKVKSFDISTADFGVDVKSVDLPVNCSAEESAAVIHDILSNDSSGSSAETLVLLNAAAAIYVSGAAANLPESYQKAELSITSGAAKDKFNAIAAESNK